MIKQILFLSLVFVGFSTAATAYADDIIKPNFNGESEASIVLIDGLAKSETWGARTKNIYTFENSDNVSIFGKYLKTATQPAGSNSKVETARYWEAGARYEKSFIVDTLNGFLQHKAESDPYNGVYTQRDSTDLGAKYFFTKTEAFTFFTEVGVRYSTQIPDFIDSNGETSKSTTGARLYLEADNKWSASTSTKFSVEHVPDFKNSDFSYTNAEAALSVAMSNILSLKTAYLLNHREIGDKKDTSMWTTALVAKY